MKTYPISKSLLDVMKSRFSCKEFDEKKSISQEDFTIILEAGRLSPSSFGFEPWHFLVVQNPKLREKISAVSWGAQRQMPGASHFIVIYARKPKAMEYNGEYLVSTIMKKMQKLPEDIIAQRSAKFKDFFDNDFSLAQDERFGFEWACRQTYLALENMLLMATAIGAEACPIEGFNKEKVEELLKTEGLLDTEIFGVSCMAAFGYCKNPPAREKTRRAMEEIVQWVK